MKQNYFPGFEMKMDFSTLFRRLKTPESQEKQLLTPAKALDEFFSFFEN
jgi:hypothetical protein